MGFLRAGAVVAAVVVAGVVAVSGGSDTNPRTPAALPGLPAPFLGTAVVGVGGGERTAAVDAYGNIVDLRTGPAGCATVAVDPKRQVAGTVDSSEALIARARLGDGRALPLWRADWVGQRYLPGTNVLRTVARFGAERATVVRRVGGTGAARADRRWLARARPLGAAAPTWARRLYERSLLVLRALTDRRSGAVAAGARNGWAYVWPRDAGAAALAFAAAGYGPEARRVARFLLGLDLGAAARFDGTGAPVPGRAAQGDAAGWVRAAASAVGIDLRREAGRDDRLVLPWRDRADYHEGVPGDYLANALADAAATPPSTPSGATFPSLERESRTGTNRAALRGFITDAGMVRVAGDPESGWDSAAAWGVRPFAQPALFPAIRRTLRAVAASSGRYGIVPSQNWAGGEDPWTAPTAWSAWGLAALARSAGSDGAARQAVADRRAALRLLAALRRATTPLGLLPERVDAQSGIPRSTTPLAWSHAFAILALRELWA